jgi:hypothetical protein
MAPVAGGPLFRRQVPLLLPGGPGVILRACPGPSCFGPRLNILNGPLRFSNLIPSNGIPGPVIATSQGASGDAKSDNQKTFSVQRSAFSVRSSAFGGQRSAVALEKWRRAAIDWVHAEP